MFTGSLDRLETSKVAFIEQKLASAVRTAMPEALASSANADAITQADQIDVKLRIRLELAFLAAMEDIGNALENEQELLRLELSMVLAGASLAGSPMIVLGQTRALAPSLAALSEPAAFAFAAHSFDLPEDPAGGQNLRAMLEHLIVDDFALITGKLASEASKAFRESASTFTGQAKALTFGPLDSMIERISLALTEARARPLADHETALEAIRDAISNLRPIVEAGLAAGSA